MTNGTDLRNQWVLTMTHPPESPIFNVVKWLSQIKWMIDAISISKVSDVWKYPWFTNNETFQQFRKFRTYYMCEDRIVRRKLLEIRFSGCVKVYGIATGNSLCKLPLTISFSLSYLIDISNLQFQHLAKMASSNYQVI